MRNEHLLMLDEIVSPQIYEKNIFRILEVAVNASPSLIQRQMKRKKMELSLGLDVSADSSDNFLSTNFTPSEDDYKGSLEEFNNPLRRFVYEFFWFWPLDGDSDKAMSALKQGDLDTVISLWESPLYSYVGQHNLAVLYHLLALSENQSQSTEIDCFRKWGAKAFLKWKEVCTDNAVWEHVQKRIKELDDIQLNAEFGNDFKKVLSVLVIQTALTVITKNVNEGKQEVAEEINNLLVQSNFDSEDVRVALDKIVKPIRKQITEEANHAQAEWAKKVQYTDKTLKAFLDRVQKHLSIIDLLFPVDNLTRIGIHDSIAETIYDGEMVYSVATEEWGKGVELLEIAEGIVEGSTLKEKILEGIEANKKNRLSGKNWCTPGYWDLPADILEIFENARKKKQSGDYDRAIALLTPIDYKKYPKVLEKCLANLLSQKSIALANDGFNVFNQFETSIIQKIFQRLRNSSNLETLLINRPTPYTETWNMPACLAHGGTNYDRWIEFTYKEIPLFCCQSCYDKHEREEEGKKSELKKEIREALAYAKLASEIDPDSKDIKENTKTINELADTLDIYGVSASDLRKKLGYTNNVSKVNKAYEKVDESCHFCESGVADSGHRITVPMSGNYNSVKRIFGDHGTYEFMDVIVPRCSSCHEIHLQLPEKVEKWEQQKETIISDEAFPELVESFNSSDKNMIELVNLIRMTEKKVKQLEKEHKKTMSAGESCPKCGKSEKWNNYICSDCDKALSNRLTGAFSFFLLLWTGYAYLLSTGKLKAFELFRDFDFTDVIDGSKALNELYISEYIVLFSPLVIGVTFLILRMLFVALIKKPIVSKRKNKVRKLKENKGGKLAKELESEKKNLHSLENQYSKTKEDVEEKKRALENAREQALTDFQFLNPKPDVPSHIKGESDYEQYPVVVELLEDGWYFGHNYMSKNESPVSIRGVSMVPKAVKAKNKPQNRRQYIKEIAKENRNNIVTCPICGISVKGQNLVRHFDKAHKDDINHSGNEELEFLIFESDGDKKKGTKSVSNKTSLSYETCYSCGASTDAKWSREVSKGLCGSCYNKESKNKKSSKKSKNTNKSYETCYSCGASTDAKWSREVSKGLCGNCYNKS